MSSTKTRSVSSHRISVLLISTSLVVVPGMAFGQSALLDPISVTATEVAPGGVQIREDQIDRANALNIKDVFAGESAVHVSGGTDVARKTYVNGVEDTNLNVKIDGARQVNSAFHHLGTAVIDPGLLKAVRIETGVGPADVGPGALGGSIAYETKDARDILEGNQPFGGFGKLFYDANTHGLSEVLTLAAQFNDFEVLIYGSNDNGDNYEDGNGTETLGTAPEMRNFLGKFAWSGPRGGRLEFQGGFLHDEGIRPARANFGALTNGAPPTFQKFTRRSYSFSYTDENPSDMFNPELVLSYNRSALFIDELAFGPFTFDLTSETVSYNGKLANTFTNDLGVFNAATFTVGVDFYRDRGRGDIEGGFATGVPLTNEETSVNVGGFMQARLTLTDQLRLSIGGRYDRQWFEGIDGTDINEDGLSTNANLEFDVMAGITPYVGAGTTFGGIPLGESAIYNFSAPWTYGGLKSSRSVNYKAGIRLEQDGFSGDINLYYNRIDDAHDRGSPVRDTTRDLKTQGVNVSAQYDYGTGFVRGTYSHNELRADGDVLVSGVAAFYGLQMGDFFTAEAAHDFYDYGIRIGASAEIALDDDSNGLAPFDGYTVAGVYGQWTPPGYEFLTLRADAKNLFDRTYVDRATAGNDNTRVVPFNEPGRTFLLTARIEY